MKESAQAAMSFVRSNFSDLGIAEDAFDGKDIHIHVPSGATPKDGPSAGITMAVALSSLFSGRPVKPALAMTGEITLRGMILPVGGIKEKILAAKRAGISTIILPEKNKKDLEEIPAHNIHDLKFHFVKDMDEVIDLAVTSGADKQKKNQN